MEKKTTRFVYVFIYSIPSFPQFSPRAPSSFWSNFYFHQNSSLFVIIAPLWIQLIQLAKV